MENATKAILVAAGLLIAIIVASMAVFLYGIISEFYQTKQNNISEEQLAEFNQQYSAYDRDDVSGFELVSLINKTIDFNQNKVYGASNIKEGNESEKLGDGYTEMSISIKIKDLPNWKLFSKADTYLYDGKNSSSNRQALIKNINEMQNLETKYGASNLTKLVSNMSYLAKFGGDGTKEIKNILGKEYTLNDLDKDKLLKYEDYLSFKRAEFRYVSNDAEYKNGQIVKMGFEQNN